MGDFVSIDKALQLSREKNNKYYRDYVNPALAKIYNLLNFNKKYIKAKGCKVWDNEGKEYLDFLGAFGALNFGHNQPEIYTALDKVKNKPILLQASIGVITGVAARNVSKLLPGNLTNTFFCNSGAEAVEGAIKLARAASNKKKIIYCQGSFHGKTMGALSITGKKKYQKPFQPLIGATENIPFANINSLEYKLKNDDVAAFIVEPIQGEGGIIVPPRGYLKKVRELCDKYNTYLILDEIQTGFGRTGKDFACEHDEIAPDIITLAKSLGGGIMPVGAFVSRKEIWNKAYGSINKALLHSSTFGGNTLSCAAVIAVINQLNNLKLSSKAAEKGDYLIAKLKKMEKKYELIKEVRGRGLMIGIEFKQAEDSLLNKISGGMLRKVSYEYLGAMIAGTLLNDYQIITAYTLNNPNVIRLEPPLIISYEDIDKLINALDCIFSENNGFINITVQNAKKLIGNYFK